MNQLEYISPDGARSTRFEEDVRIDGTAFIWLPPISGLLSSAFAVQGRRTLNQIGENPSGSVVGTRNVEFTVLIAAPTHEQTWALREKLGDALWTQPPRPGEVPRSGTLRLYRAGQQPLEISALPVSSPSDEEWDGPNSCRVRVEFWCADPLWKELYDRAFELRTVGGGFTFPLAHSFSSQSANNEADIFNPGSADAPILVKIYGEMTTPRLVNVTTGEVLEFSGAIAADEYLAVDTGYSRKSAKLVQANGTESNALPRLNFDISSLWNLRRGTNRVRLEADNNVSGRAFLSFKAAYGGV